MRSPKNYHKKGDDYLRSKVGEVDFLGEFVQRRVDGPVANFIVTAQDGTVKDGVTSVSVDGVVNFGFLSKLEPGEYTVDIEVEPRLWIKVMPNLIIEADVPAKTIKIDTSDAPDRKGECEHRQAEFVKALEGKTITKIEADCFGIKIDTAEGDELEISHGMDELYYSTDRDYEEYLND